MCHLEAVLGERQAYISQQLMAMRDVRVITSRREGRYVYYRLADARVLDLLHLAWRIREDPSTCSPGDKIGRSVRASAQSAHRMWQP